MKRARNSAIEKRDQLTSAPNHRPDQVAEWRQDARRQNLRRQIEKSGEEEEEERKSEWNNIDTIIIIAIRHRSSN